jgi:hypothetical protein
MSTWPLESDCALGTQPRASAMVQGSSPPGVIDEPLGVAARLPTEPRWVRGADVRRVVDACPREPARDARAYAPDVRDGVVKPHVAAKGLLVHLPYAVCGMLVHEVERHLAEERVGAYPRRGRDASLLSHLRGDAVCELPRVRAVGLQCPLLPVGGARASSRAFEP